MVFQVAGDWQAFRHKIRGFLNDQDFNPDPKLYPGLYALGKENKSRSKRNYDEPLTDIGWYLFDPDEHWHQHFIVVLVTLFTTRGSKRNSIRCTAGFANLLGIVTIQLFLETALEEAIWKYSGEIK